MGKQINGNFRIVVRLLKGVIYKYDNVDGYTVEAGDIITFKDRVTGNEKRFHASNCEIYNMGDCRG